MKKIENFNLIAFSFLFMVFTLDSIACRITASEGSLSAQIGLDLEPFPKLSCPQGVDPKNPKLTIRLAANPKTKYVYENAYIQTDVSFGKNRTGQYRSRNSEDIEGVPGVKKTTVFPPNQAPNTYKLKTTAYLEFPNSSNQLKIEHDFSEFDFDCEVHEIDFASDYKRIVLKIDKNFALNSYVMTLNYHFQENKVGNSVRLLGEGSRREGFSLAEGLEYDDGYLYYPIFIQVQGKTELQAIFQTFEGHKQFDLILDSENLEEGQALELVPKQQ